jgi:hypothetical protein
MATLVRCIEGHAFDRAASETCPICGSTVWKNEPVKEPVKEPVYENKPPLDRTKIIELAVVIGLFIFCCAMGSAIIFGVGQFMPDVKSAIYNYWQRVEAHVRDETARERAQEQVHACEERKLHDPNVICSFREAQERDKAARERTHSCEERKLHEPNVVCSFRAVAPPGTFDPKIRFGPK